MAQIMRLITEDGSEKVRPVEDCFVKGYIDAGWTIIDDPKDPSLKKAMPKLVREQHGKGPEFSAGKPVKGAKKVVKAEAEKPAVETAKDRQDKKNKSE
jgi:hypothetical protein